MAESREAANPAWCYYQNDTILGRKYGGIYNWYVISDPRGFGPERWYVPTNEVWIILESFLGSSVTGLGLKCTGEFNENGNGYSVKFCVPLGGYRDKE